MVCAALALVLVQAQSPSPAASPTPTPRPVPTGPTVVITTSLGTIKAVLNKEQSPISVENFLKYARSGFYDGTIFHRVMPNFMIQGGGMTPDMQEKPTQAPIRNEAKNGLRNSRGTLAMARTNDPNSATSQFFINVRDNHALDFGIRGAGYAVFGEVVEGMDVVDKIVNVATTAKPPHENVPLTPVVIKSVREVGADGAPKAPARTAASPAASPRPRPSAPASPRPSPTPTKKP
jgi:peptidyl-prolyl cis-trans isomerase A (cyclophilin A)